MILFLVLTAFFVGGFMGIFIASICSAGKICELEKERRELLCQVLELQEKVT
jgi:hypothetical protein